MNQENWTKKINYDDKKHAMSKRWKCKNSVNQMYEKTPLNPLRVNILIIERTKVSAVVIAKSNFYVCERKICVIKQSS